MVSCKCGSYAATVNEHSFKNFFMIFLFFNFVLFQVLMKNGGTILERGRRHALSRKAKQVQKSNNWFFLLDHYISLLSIIHSSILGNILFELFFFDCICLGLFYAYFFYLDWLERSSRRTSDRVRRSKIDLDASQLTDVHNYRYLLVLHPLIKH